MIANFYFWKWADNDLPGRPVEVFSALMRGELHPALQAFDARPLVRKLEKIAVRDADPALWELCVVPNDRPRNAHHLFLTCPRQFKLKEACLIGSKLTCFEEDRAALARNFPPKRSEFYWGQWPDEPAYNVTLDQLPVLLKRIRPKSPDPLAILSNRQTSFVQCYGHGRRFYVEWTDNYDVANWRHFDHWRAQDRSRLRAGSTVRTRGYSSG